MDKEQEILEISKLVFELTLVGGTGADLDSLLERLFSVLANLQNIQVQPRGMILLCNPRQRLIQVAQFGVPALWQSAMPEDEAPEPGLNDRGAYVTRRLIPGETEAQACFILPLRDESRLLGEAVLFIEPTWTPDVVEHVFMSDLARALSGLVTRSLVNETLRVREIELEEARTDAIRRLGAASEYRDNETGMHIMRMTNFAVAIAKALDLPQAQREILYITAPMHDVGKIGIADAILLKPGKLTGEEYDVMKTHTQIGVRILTGDDELIAAARDIAASHHENWDGSGYPARLKGEEIPILARICAVADVFDALTSSRPYKEAWPLASAIDWIRAQSGEKFDPAVVNAFDRALPEILRIRELYRDDIIDPNQSLDLPPVVPREVEWVRWEESLSVGIDAIDEHHRYLFDLTNDLFVVVRNKLGAKEVARLLKALEQYTQIHFRAEERMMAHYGYDAMPRQLTQHHQFEQKLNDFYDELHDNPLTAQFDILVYLKDWLVKHICFEDAGLRSLVKA